MSLPHAILTALFDDDLTGYELARQFEVSLGFFWQASHQQIYRELKKLLNEQLLDAKDVPQQGKPDKKIYSLTNKGRDSLSDWVMQTSKARSGKDELLIRLYNLGQGQDDSIIEAIEQRLQRREERLKLYLRIEAKNYQNPERFSRRKQGIYLALRSGIMQEENTIAWCKEALNFLNHETP